MNYSNSRKNIIYPLIVALAVVLGIVIGRSVQRGSGSHFTKFVSDIPVRSQDKLSAVLSIINSDYVDVPQLDSIAEEVIPLILQRLDPHSAYISAKDLARINEPLEGEFEGIGILFNMFTDTVQVINVVPRGPSDKAGIIGGDRIVTVNDTVIAGVKMDQNQVMKMFRGPRGTEVKLGILRLGTGKHELMQIGVVRDKIPVKSVDAAFMIEPGIGYVKLLRFSRTSHQEVVEAVEGLKREGMEKLIFDLKGNSGGYLDQAILIANEFLPDKTPIIYTRGRVSPKKAQYADGRGRFQDLDVILLIDEGSASSSEILAGALQDNDRGTIVGRRSFGKGLVQKDISFSDGSLIRLTVARYYTPTGRNIQKPYDKGVDEYNNDMMNRYLHNEFMTADSVKLSDSLKYITPKGKVVYGGGGIMPDVFVPMDTTRVSDYFRQLIGKNVILRYSMMFADKHRSELNAIRTMAEMKEYIGAQKNLFDDFVAFSAREGVIAKKNELIESREIIEAQLRAYISRHTPLDDNGFYYYIYPIDEIVVRGVETAHGK